MKLPPFNMRHASALKEKIRRLPGQKLPLLTPRVSRTNDVSRDGQQSSAARRASVLVPLCNRNGVPSVLFTLRTQRVGSHKGQVSFPGGHQEDNETAEEAAIREMREELFSANANKHNISSEDSRVFIIGECETIEAITGTLVSPVVGFMEKDVDDLSVFTKDENEVEEIFTRPISDLVTPTNRSLLKYDFKGKTMELPQWGAPGDRHHIWGLTACIMDTVLRSLIVPMLEKSTIKT